MPTGIGKLFRLKSLNLGDNPFTKIPESIGNLVNLETLSLPNIDTFPTSISNLINLKKLMLATEYIPDVLTKLPSLKELTFQYKLLKPNPEYLQILKNLDSNVRIAFPDIGRFYSRDTLPNNYTDITPFGSIRRNT